MLISTGGNPSVLTQQQGVHSHCESTTPKGKNMRITILTLGSQGDVQPYVALGLGLQAVGHEVRLATLDPFQAFVSRQGLDFASLGGISQEFSQRYKDEASRQTIVFNGFLGRFKLWRIFGSSLKRFIANCWDVSQSAEAIIYSQLALPGYHIAEKLGVPGYASYVSPQGRTRAFSHPFYTSDFHLGGTYNWLTHFFEEQCRWQFTQETINQWRQETLNLPPIPFTGLHRRQHKQRIPILYCYSPAVAPKPFDWPDWAHVTGYWLLDRSPDWQAPTDLVDFLESGPPPVYVGFGDRTDYNPEAIDLLRK
jgi:UDP:flavonoid glycosyltransferase YjiC (YdhE family)